MESEGLSWNTQNIDLTNPIKMFFRKYYPGQSSRVLATARSQSMETMLLPIATISRRMSDTEKGREEFRNVAYIAKR